MPPRLETYLAIADDVAKISHDLAAAATMRYRTSPIELTERDDVLIGLLLKIDSSFRALIADARLPRSEAMHHLKTIIESFIYVYVVSTDITDGAAASVKMEAARHKLALVRDDPTPDASQIATWTEILKEYKADGIQPIGKTKLAGLAKAHGLWGWYASVYRLACEPAHLGDLWEFIPDTPGAIQVGPSKHSALHAERAVYYGLQVMLAMLEFVNGVNELGLHVDVEPLRQRLAAI